MSGPSSSSSHHLISPFPLKVSLVRQGCCLHSLHFLITLSLPSVLKTAVPAEVPGGFLGVQASAVFLCPLRLSPPLVAVLLSSVEHVAIPQRLALALLFFSLCTLPGHLFFFFFKIFIYLFLERGKGGRKRGKHQCVRETPASCLSHAPNWGPGPNPGMCPDWESNLRPFTLQDETQPTELHQSGGPLVSCPQLSRC